MSLLPEAVLLHWPAVVILAVVSLVLLVARDRRLATLALLGQYLWLSTQMSYDLYHLVAGVRLGLGVALCLILYITAEHVEAALRRVPAADEPNTAFRLAALALATLLAWGVWQRYPLALVPDRLGMTSYWLVFDGILLMLMSTEPLSMGLGLMTMLNGFEGVYLYEEQGLVIAGLVGIVDICIALGITLFAEVAAGAVVRRADAELSGETPDRSGGEALPR